MTPWLSG